MEMAPQVLPKLTATTSTLPSKMAPELWMNCFQYLSHTDLVACMNVCSKWYYIADNPLLWQDLDLTSLLEKTYHLPPEHVPSETLVARIENARSIKAVPRLTRKFTSSRRWQFGDDLAYILDRLHHSGPLPNLRSFTFRSSPWAQGLSACLPHLVNLDISRIDIDARSLTGVIGSLGSSLRTLNLDGLRIYRPTVCAILDRQHLEHLSLAMCLMTPDVLQWFLAGFPIPPVCRYFDESVDPQLLSGRCHTLGSTFHTCAAKKMPCLRELDLKYLGILEASWLRQFHTVRLGLPEEKDPLVSEIPEASNSSPLTRDIHIDVRGCKNLSLAELQAMESSWPGTWFTPTLKAIGKSGAPPPVAATALPEQAILFALQEPGATLDLT